MDFRKEEVNEVVIKTTYYYREYNYNFYNDCLSINKYGVSYKRNKNDDNEKVYEWSYDDHRYGKDNQFDSVVSSIHSAIEKGLFNSNLDINDRNRFNISIWFKDNTHIEYEFQGDFASNGLTQIAEKVICVIPNQHPYPDLINLFVDKRLKTSDLNKINKDELVALMFSEAGAMGSPGQTEIITYHYNKYVRYSGNALFDENVNQYEVFKLFDGLFDDKKLMYKSFQILIINNRNWVYLNLGFGNHLFVEEFFWKKIWNVLFHYEKGYRYGGWHKLVRYE